MSKEMWVFHRKICLNTGYNNRHIMFIELTEIITDGLQSYQNNKNKLRKILVNVTKIQSVYADTLGKTIIQLRRENIKTEESYEQVVTQIKESMHNGNV